MTIACGRRAGLTDSSKSGLGVFTFNFISSSHIIMGPESQMSRCGLAVRRKADKQKDLGSIPLRLSFLFKICDLWTPPVTLSPTVHETLKWLSPLLILMQESFCCDSVVRYSVPLPPTQWDLGPRQHLFGGNLL